MTKEETKIECAGDAELAIAAANARISLHRLRDFNGLEGELADAFEKIDSWLRETIEERFPSEFLP